MPQILKRIYFPYEGRRAEHFFALKNPTASTGFEPVNLGTKGQHATSRPPKPQQYVNTEQFVTTGNSFVERSYHFYKR